MSYRLLRILGYGAYIDASSAPQRSAVLRTVGTLFGVLSGAAWIGSALSGRSELMILVFACGAVALTSFAAYCFAAKLYGRIAVGVVLLFIVFCGFLLRSPGESSSP